MASQKLTEAPDSDQAIESAPNKTREPLSFLKPREERTVGDHFRNYSIELLAIIFWLYTLMKVFFYDFDILVLSNFFPDYEWLLSFKLLFALTLLCVIWLWIGTRDAIAWVIYISFYPLIVFLIKIPLFIFQQKSWVLAIGFFNAIASFFANLKYKLIFITIFLCSFSIAIFSENNDFVAIASVLLVVLTLISYARSFIAAIKPSTIFQIYSRALTFTRKNGYTTFSLDEEIRNLPTESLKPHQKEKWETNLQTSVLFSRLCLFVGKKLRIYQNSEWRIIPSIFSLLGVCIFTVTSFSGVYYALFRMHSDFFRYAEEPSWFTFFLYSFNNLILSATAEVSAAIPLSQAVYIIQSSLSFLLIIMLVTLLISYRTQRSSSELDEVIATIEGEGRYMEDFIREEYGMPSIEVAIGRLKDAQAGLMGIIYWLSREI